MKPTQRVPHVRHANPGVIPLQNHNQNTSWYIPFNPYILNILAFKVAHLHRNSKIETASPAPSTHNYQLTTHNCLTGLLSSLTPTHRPHTPPDSSKLVRQITVGSWK